MIIYNMQGWPMIMAGPVAMLTKSIAYILNISKSFQGSVVYTITVVNSFALVKLITRISCLFGNIPNGRFMVSAM
jgi:hypothetical protein